ncbi:MAG: carbohydrate binding domain-containing protein, partial [Nitrosospira sp.]|nr:carbohydrate binding domain-containing protein [Nitrosospira sp.]
MITVKKTLVMVVLTIVQHAAYAATYYIDSAQGNDAWSGAFPEPTGTPAVNGPWASLRKLSEAPLQPGDIVALRCGRKWTETLKIPASGTASAAINITSYPGDCKAAPPTIEGAHPIPAHLWSKHASNTYKADLSRVNLLQNPGFETGLTGWRIWSPRSDAEVSLASSCETDSTRCMKFVSGTGSGNSSVYSHSFSILGGANYHLRFKFKANSGTRVSTILRRNAEPHDTVGIRKTVVGNGEWQEISFPFKATAQIDNARLDFDMAPGGYITHLDDVRIEPQYPTPKAARLSNTPLTLAHHPNRGFNPHEPASMYLRNAADSNNVATSNGGRGSSYITSGSDLQLPGGVALQAGLGISVRTNAWTIDNRKIASVSGTAIVLDKPTSYPVAKSWGYFLTGALWMVDSPNEWYFDASDKAVYIGTTSDSAPNEIVYITALDTCIDFSGRKYVRIENITAQGCVTGVRMENSSAVELHDMRIRDISEVGVYAPGAASASLTRATIERVGAEAVLGIVPDVGVATSLVLADSTITDAGVTRINGNIVSLPSPTVGAVISGNDAKVSRNVISGSGFNGIVVRKNSLIENNLIEDSCVTLDDCGAIYTYKSAGSNITGNIIRRVWGGLEGMPIGRTSLAEGIYLDELSNANSVMLNTVTEAVHGIFLHNAFNNHIDGNILYGNRGNQIWLKEDSKLLDYQGDLYGNRIADNLIFPLVPSTPIGHYSTILDTSRFATYYRNRYSSLVSSRITGELWPTGSASFRFQEWQARNQDANGSVVSPAGYASYKALGNNIVPNGSFSNGTLGWVAWNAQAPLATRQLTTCGSTSCIELTAGGSTSEIATPPFSVVANGWYRVTFDIKAGWNGQAMYAMLQRGGGGGNGYDALSAYQPITSDQNLRRVSFVTQSSKTIHAADPNTGDIGARLYFKGLLPGQKVYLANVEIVPVSPAEAGLETRLFSNPSYDISSENCPDEATRPELCGRYVDFLTGAPITWPIEIAAYGSRIAYTLDITLVDSDSDGIIDAQDICPDTPPSAPVNASGC